MGLEFESGKRRGGGGGGGGGGRWRAASWRRPAPARRALRPCRVETSRGGLAGVADSSCLGRIFGTRSTHACLSTWAKI